MARKQNDKTVIKLFYDGHKYTEDVTVIVNGKNYIIKRGVEVEVPFCVKYALENAAIQERSAQKYIDTMHNA